MPLLASHLPGRTAAKKLTVHRAVIGRYKRDKITPSVEMAAAIAEAQEVSLDYLAENTDWLLKKGIK